VRAQRSGKHYALFAAFNFASKCSIIRTKPDQNFGENLEVMNSSARFPDAIVGSFGVVVARVLARCWALIV
jgi:hypothetical protein